MPNQDWVQYSLSMTFVLLLLAAVLWWLSRRNKGFLLPAAKRRIQILEAYPMGMRHKLLLIQVDSQRMLLAVNPNDIQKLHAWPADSSPPVEQGASDAH
ncbi:MAG: flagellar biosynthetic protein FliO [Betaproteobacteria bacterium]|jgi:flagellar biogenesis protein FliO|nr:flagellar biosynthetic protein FliO [Betaproteobacteria bacterium]